MPAQSGPAAITFPSSLPSTGFLASAQHHSTFHFPEGFLDPWVLQPQQRWHRLESRREIMKEWGRHRLRVRSGLRCEIAIFPSPLAPACRMRGGKNCIYHLSGSARTELREAGQHKIIIHKHEITKSLGTEQQNYFISEGGHSIF